MGIDYSLVFIYLGEQLPEYLTISIAQARLFNKTCSIYFIANREAIEKHSSLIKIMSLFQTKIITYESLNKCTEHVQLDQTFENCPEDFGIHGFTKWKYYIERFFCLHELISQYHLNHVIQVECDVMLYLDIEETLSLFLNFYPEIACPFLNDHYASVTIVYISGEHVSKKLVQFLAEAIHQKPVPRDMHLLALYKNQTSNRVDYLPTITKEMLLHWQSKEQNPASENLCNRLKEWDSIFDIDYLAVLFEIKLWVYAPYLDPSIHLFNWERDTEERWVPYVYEQCGAQKHRYRINTLHAMHKNLIKFQSLGPMPYLPNSSSPQHVMLGDADCSHLRST